MLNMHMHSVLLDDIVCAILLLSSKDQFVGNQRYLQEAFWKLKDKYEDIFKGLIFSVDLYPYSQLLERVFSRLELSRIISFDNPDYKSFILTPNGRDYIEKKVLPIFSNEECKVLENIGKDFAQIVGSG